MEFGAFFQIFALGAMGIVATLLAWTVRTVLQLSNEVAAMRIHVDTLQSESQACEIDRHHTTSALTAVQKDVATLLERSTNTNETLKRIEGAIVPRPPARSRPKAP